MSSSSANIGGNNAPAEQDTADDGQITPQVPSGAADEDNRPSGCALEHVPACAMAGPLEILQGVLEKAEDLAQ